MKPLTASLTRALLLLVFGFFALQSFAQTSIIPYGSSWRYLDNDTRPAGWETSAFSDGSWSVGNGQFGYGDGDEATVINHGGCTPIASCGTKYITTYFRKSVTIANPSAYASFTLNVLRDDGVVVYINGVERYASNMPAGRTHGTLASGNATDEGNTPQTTTLSSAFFSAGTNVIAVELHQSSTTSSDITFDLELLANSAPVGLVNFSDAWKYLDNNTRPANWHTAAFNDASWASGNSELGYGDAPATTVSYGSDASNKHITTYFRKNFNITGLSGYNGFTMNIVRDDGFVVYVNGVEVARDNMPGGTPTHSTLASAAISGTDETTPISFSLSTCNFVEGTNTIAVEMHQNDAGSSDLSFNMELVGTVGGGTPTLSRGPYLQMGNQTSITIRWRTSAACYGRVQVGPSNGTYTTASADETCPTTDHVITINGLTADTKYFYQVSSTTGTIFEGGASNFFTTAPPANTTRKIRIAAFGDCGRGNATYQDENLTNYRNYLTSNGIDAPDAWILLGDNAYSSGTDAEYSSNFFGIYGSTILKNHKLYPAPGNHDYGNTSANKSSRSMPYHSIFTVPQNAECGGVASTKQNYYSYDIGNVHFLSLDSYGMESDGTDMLTSGTSALKTWINADLAANTKKWVVAYWHHPPYTKTSHNSDTESDLIAIRQNFIGYLESRGVDLIINGHSHGYERGYQLRNFTGLWNTFNPATHAISTSSATYTSSSTCPYIYNSTPANHGTVYVVAGSTGASGGTNTNFGAYAFPYSVNDGGVFFFEVEDNRLDAKMLRRNGTIFDRFTIMKDAGLTRNYNVAVNTPITLTASWPNSVNNYGWSTGANTRGITLTPTSTGVTAYSVSDNFGCVTDQFTVSAFSTLPVSISSFDVKLNKNKVDISWTTSSENNNSHFTVERSSNGVDFSLLATVKGAGTSAQSKSYSYVDPSPLTGISYYRLSQTDFDQHIQYLGTKQVVNNNPKDFEVRSVSLKNSTLSLQINSSTQGNFLLRVYDLQGREWKNEKIHIPTGNSRKDIVLNRGVFIWEIRSDKGEMIRQKVVVQ